MLRLDALPEDTRRVFGYCRTHSALESLGLALFGGTALSLLLGHRQSEDLDFFSFESSLPIDGISAFLTSCRKDNMEVHNILDTVRISQARINGIRLEDYIQEYQIDGVRVSFAAMTRGGDSRRTYFANAPMLSGTQSVFQIPTLQTLFESKALTLRDRVTSRDLFDLMVLIRDHGCTIEQLLDAIVRIDHIELSQASAVLEILLGHVPVDADDPGFYSIRLNASLDGIYAFFKTQIDAYEQAVVIRELGSKSE